MAAISLSDCVVHKQFTGTIQPAENPLQIKWVGIEVPATSDGDDTVAITLSEVDITTLWDVMAWTHSTVDSIIVTESTEMTCAVSSGVLTVTIKSSDNDKKRFIMIGGV